MDTIHYAIVCALSLAVLLYTEWRNIAWVQWVTKPIASTAFVALALHQGALESAYGGAVLGALLLSWLGDVLLIVRGAKGAFLAGLGSFLLGHVLFAVAFLVRGIEPSWSLAASLPALLLALVVWRWLRPFLKGPMRAAVAAYITVISVMLVLAIGAAGRGHWWILVGATGFFVSDLSVARNRFVAPGLVNRLWGLPLYYAAQLVLAATVGLP